MITRTLTAAMLFGCTACSSAPEPAPVPPVTTGPPVPQADASPPPVPEVPVRQALRLTREQPLELTDFVEVSLVDYVIEQTAPPPNSTEAPQHGVTIQLEVDGYDVPLYQSAAVDAPGAVAWIGDYRVEVAGHDPGLPSVDLHIDRIGPARVGDSTRTERIAKGETIDLGDGATMEFRSHGHKRVKAGGPSSPLLVRVTYRDGTGSSEDSQASLHPPEEATWRWRDHEFVLTEHDYGVYMVLEVARLSLAPVVLEPAE